MLKQDTPLYIAFLFTFFISSFNFSLAQKREIETRMHYLQAGQKPEWDEFEKKIPEKNFSARFNTGVNEQEYTLRLRQYDVRQQWKVILNDRILGNLVEDENDLTIYLPVPAQALVNGENKLLIEPPGSVPDDIMAGEISLESQPLNKLLGECRLDVTVVDRNSSEQIPSRITITNEAGSLQTIGAQSNDSLAVRPGMIYTKNGKASFGIPAGSYTVYASRGFEYGVDSVKIIINPGDHFQRKLLIQREVSTQGWISADTHLHTLSYSKHGDATIKERLLTIAGEGIELPVITEHNVMIDIKPLVDSLQLVKYFTPVIGTELTTAVGHFNLFPLSAATPLPDPSVKNWKNLFRNHTGMYDSMVIILNHARDIHNGFRPFDPQIHIGITGRRLDNWKFPANAMEVINSGSQQTERMQLLYDWFGMTNRGYFLTPVGSSDSHDVSRYLVGQSRTYISAKDDDAGHINIAEAIRNFRDGKVLVSFGLFTEVIINNNYGAGDLVPAGDSVEVTVKVSGPGWTEASRAILYANGQNIGERLIENGVSPGVKWEGMWKLPKTKQDVFLVAFAEGPDKHSPFWPIAKPYQTASSRREPKVMGFSGPVWIDADHNGRRTTAYEYATAILKKSKGNIRKLVKLLVPYDEAVAVQAASLLEEQGCPLNGPAVTSALQHATEKTKKGFNDFIKEWKLSGGQK